MKLSVKVICETAALLAIAIASQFLKNFSVYLTGPIVNTVLILAVLFCGLASGLILSVITPVTAWMISGSPLMNAMPLLAVLIMCGNAVLVLSVWFFTRKAKNLKTISAACILGALLKAACMTVTIVLLLIPFVGPTTALPAKALTAAKTTFSVTQLITALIGSFYAVVLWVPLKKVSRETI